MKKIKRILALTGVVILVSLYLLTLISSFTATPYRAAFFQASVYATIIIPVLLYGYMLIYRVLKKDKEEKGEE